MIHRKTYRAAASAALAVSSRFASFTEKRSWAFASDTSDLPAWGVMTPDEPATDLTKDSTHRETDVMVIVKRQGGDTLHDDLDDDATEIEAVVWAALAATDAYHVSLARTRNNISGEGAKRTGLVEVTFRCMAEIPNP